MNRLLSFILRRKKTNKKCVPYILTTGELDGLIDYNKYYEVYDIE